MKPIAPWLALLLATSFSSASLAQTCATVQVENVRPAQGHLMVAAFTDAESFGRQAQVSLRLPAGEATMRFELCGLSGPEVALRLFQDLDGDGKLATNVLGIPSEPWGASGKPGVFGPKWETTKVALDGGIILVTLTP
jgi:uncharacterized protein (DUF2141 family)